MTKLLIVESPAKSKTISKYLGKDYVVMASVGHVRDLPKSNKNAVDVKAGFVPHYEVVEAKKKVVADLKKASKKSTEVLLATDPDREGEAIAWHIGEILGIPKSKMKRVVYHEITKEAITEALNHPRDIDMHLKEAQEARRVLDRLFGYDLSGLIWKKVRYGLSAGRVQSPALRILMEREREIRAFKPEAFWVITADTTNKAKDNILLLCSVEPKTQAEVDDILKKAEKGSWIVQDIQETKVGRQPKPPFITSTLQQAASSRLGMTPSRTMRVAQRLYEAGFITYMRTDSTNLSTNALGQIKDVVTKLFGAELFEAHSFKSKSKNAQEAHEAIRPTTLSKKTVDGTPEQKKLYELIWARTVASQMQSALTLRTKIVVEVGDGSVPYFSVNGSRILSLGWLLADPGARSEDVEVPKVTVGEELNLVKLNSEEKATQPPSRYSEAGLVKELEKRGIGRPSTYAAIIQTLVSREYVIKEGRSLVPTDTGDVVSSFVEDNFKDYISDDFTAEMENELDEIAFGTRGYEKTLKDFYTPFTKEIKSKSDIAKLTDLGRADKKFKCPKCGSDMIIKLGRGGKFISCARFPDCDGALTIDGEEIKQDEPIGTYPATGESVFIKTGRFGPYVQVGEMVSGKKAPKPKRASIPKDKKIEEVTLADALKYLSLPRELGVHPETSKTIMANVGRFGPYIAHNIDPKPDFRSLKGEDDPYTITFERALEILKEPKKFGRRGKKKEA